MKILYLTLKKQFFDAIASGQKKEEYRDMKPYWAKRLEAKTYDEIYFRNGYARNAPFMRVEYKGMIKEQHRYIIKLGRVLEIGNYD